MQENETKQRKGKETKIIEKNNKEKVEKIEKTKTQFKHAKFIRISGIVLGIYYILAIGVSRYITRGPDSFYDNWWVCNAGMILGVIGMLTLKLQMVGGACLLIFFPSIFWCIDVVSYLVAGKLPLGSASYMFKDDTPFLEIASTTHHLWYLPFALFIISLETRININSWLISNVFVTFIVVGARIFTPKYTLLPDGRNFLLNINMAYNFWDDCPIKFMHYFDDWHPVVYLTYMNFIGYFGFHLVAFIICRTISRLISRSKK
ncbi:hypothetical protein M0811_11071 [Anaeramoeba ignava]|uniref:Uncharacterized protein n=1 Tax=Anaeramoeba ignava TaxID=1746090 RepID=A0A9Q0R7N8_ANAIG|nr:hypothetical protein M0811_11071 [Anaeramoeba ignava]